MSFTAWWSAWKYVAILGLIASVSLWGNLHQYGTRRAAVEKARADVLADTLKVTAGIARDRTKDDATLLATVQAIADQRVKTQVIYTKAADARPLAANCAPGQQRMDAVNAGVKP